MLLLSGEDVGQLLPMNEAIAVIKEAYQLYAKKEYKMPERIFSKVRDDDQYLLMPCFADDCISLKVVVSYPSNRNRGRPVTQGLVLVNDLETGDPLAVINGTMLTAIKTGAVSGVAMEAFRKDAESVGLVGTGFQGIYQLIAACSATTVKKVYLYNRTPEKLDAFIEEFRRVSGQEMEMFPVKDVQELVKHSDMIITATTSLTPVLPDTASLYKGKVVIGVGSYDREMREFPKALFEGIDYYYIDSEQGKVECGDIIDPLKNGWVKEEQVVLMSEFLEQGEGFAFDPSRPIVFKTVSMALFDACIANYLYKKAIRLGAGLRYHM
jgi:ornithine cyclodeaminase/alanine dehydrogenase-like protein (mu-crystallin family)